MEDITYQSYLQLLQILYVRGSASPMTVLSSFLKKLQVRFWISRSLMILDMIDNSDDEDEAGLRENRGEETRTPSLYVQYENLEDE